MTFAPSIGDGAELLDLLQYQQALAGYSLVDADADCEVTPAAADLAVDVGSGEARLGGPAESVAGATDVALDAADVDQPRKDLVYLDANGDVQVETGTPSDPAPPGRDREGAAVPAPLIPAGAFLPLAVVWVPAGATDIDAGDIQDRRVPQIDLRDAYPKVPTAFVQTEEPEYVEPGTWVNPDTGVYSVAHAGEWYPVPPATITEETATFDEDDVVVGLDDAFHDENSLSLGRPFDARQHNFIRQVQNVDGTDSSQSTFGLAVKPDGTRVVVCDRGDNTSRGFFYEYTLSEPWNMETATFNYEFSTLSDLERPNACRWHDDGNEFYATGHDNDFDFYLMYQFTASTPYDLSSLSHTDSYEMPENTSDYRLYDILFTPDGETVYSYNERENDFYELSLSDPYQLGTATSEGHVGASHDPDGVSFQWGMDGMGLISVDGDAFYGHRLDEPYDLSTLNPPHYVVEPDAEANAVSGFSPNHAINYIYISPDGTKSLTGNENNDPNFDLWDLATESGEASVTWRENPMNLRSWDLASYAVESDGETAQVGVLTPEEGTSVSLDLTDTSEHGGWRGIMVRPNTLLSGLDVTVDPNDPINFTEVQVFHFIKEDEYEVLERRRTPDVNAGDTIHIPLSFASGERYGIVFDVDGDETVSENIGTSDEWPSDDITVVNGAQDWDTVTRLYTVSGVKAYRYGEEPDFTDIGINTSISDIDADDIAIRATFERNDLVSHPTLDYVARRYLP